MAFMDKMKSLVGKKETTGQELQPVAADVLLTSQDFPIFRAEDVDLSRYRKVPLMSLVALGAAFSTLPESARTITGTVTTQLSTGSPLFVGLWPKGVTGTMIDKGLGFSGNIRGITPTGRSGIVGRMRYQLLNDGLPVTTSTSMVAPFDPMTMIVAATLIRIDQKLDALREKAEEILQFLKLDKQSKQRGNLEILTEIMEDYRQDCKNEKKCRIRSVDVQNIKREARQNLIFYQEQISQKLHQQKAIHSTLGVQNLQKEVLAEFSEYQLSSYLYAYASFLEVLLQKNFENTSAVAARLEEQDKKYSNLYSECRAQIASYQRSAVETQLIGGLGNAARIVGQKIASVPGLRKGPVDEALINAGEALEKHNQSVEVLRLDRFDSLEDSRIGTFAESLQTMNRMCNQHDTLLTDGENLYIMEAI